MSTINLIQSLYSAAGSNMIRDTATKITNEILSSSSNTNSENKSPQKSSTNPSSSPTILTLKSEPTKVIRTLMRVLEHIHQTVNSPSASDDNSDALVALRALLLLTSHYIQQYYYSSAKFISTTTSSSSSEVVDEKIRSEFVNLLATKIFDVLTASFSSNQSFSVQYLSSIFTSIILTERDTPSLLESSISLKRFLTLNNSNSDNNHDQHQQQQDHRSPIFISVLTNINRMLKHTHRNPASISAACQLLSSGLLDSNNIQLQNNNQKQAIISTETWIPTCVEGLIDNLKNPVITSTCETVHVISQAISALILSQQDDAQKRRHIRKMFVALTSVSAKAFLNGFSVIVSSVGRTDATRQEDALLSLSSAFLLIVTENEDDNQTQLLSSSTSASLSLSPSVSAMNLMTSSSSAASLSSSSPSKTSLVAKAQQAFSAPELVNKLCECLSKVTDIVMSSNNNNRSNGNNAAATHGLLLDCVSRVLLFVIGNSNEGARFSALQNMTHDEKIVSLICQAANGTSSSEVEQEEEKKRMLSKEKKNTNGKKITSNNNSNSKIAAHNNISTSNQNLASSQILPPPSLATSTSMNSHNTTNINNNNPSSPSSSLLLLDGSMTMNMNSSISFASGTFDPIFILSQMTDSSIASVFRVLKQTISDFNADSKKAREFVCRKLKVSVLSFYLRNVIQELETALLVLSVVTSVCDSESMDKRYTKAFFTVEFRDALKEFGERMIHKNLQRDDTNLKIFENFYDFIRRNTKEPPTNNKKVDEHQPPPVVEKKVEEKKKKSREPFVEEKPIEVKPKEKKGGCCC